MDYNDKTLPCTDCGGQFIFTAGEQAFYADKGFINEPTRCSMRRRLRKGGLQETMIPGTVCPCDVSCKGRIPRGEYSSRRKAQHRTVSTNTYEQGYEQHQPYTGSLPTEPVLATVLRIDPTGRFLFARVKEGGFDVYVHASLFQNMHLNKNDEIYLTIEASDRGPRAKSLQLV